ncbi:DUF4260 domain-containing protein [Microvirga subterranea]|uniref:DUF4260 domain-containing protein n=1 Tax=Microvirga subterranea TaxID=186651 RepID=UPI001AEF106F|nr:DUF4260 domain-containing protein [Microvirga subterranea]
MRTRPEIAAVAGAPRLLLRFEGLALLAAATVGFHLTSLSWWLYGVLFFVPDVSFAAYGAGPRVGAVVYNALHSTIGPALLAGTGLLLGDARLLGVAAIWAAHIGFDRMLGYGLKYASGFSDTHLGRIGRPDHAQADA